MDLGGFVGGSDGSLESEGAVGIRMRDETMDGYKVCVNIEQPSIWYLDTIIQCIVKAYGDANSIPTVMVTFPDDSHRNSLATTCHRYPRLRESRTCIAWGNGSLQATLVIVGEAPSEGNPDATQWQGGNHTGMAYTSRRSGRKIRTLFASLGFAGWHLIS